MKHIHSVEAAAWMLRIGLAFVFLYAAVSSLRHPVLWAAFLPTFLTERITGATLVTYFSIYEVALTLWLLSGRFTRYVAALCFLTFGGIVLANPSQLLTTFRDIGLAFMALALFFLSQPTIRQR